VLNRRNRIYRLNRMSSRMAERVARQLSQWRQRRNLGGLPGAAASDVEEVLRVARLSFVQLQAAWDRADLGALGQITTGPLLEDLRQQLAERGPGLNRTEVVSLDARLLSVEELHEAYVATVEFSGLIGEALDTVACPFRELWLLANVKAEGRGWQLARVQSLS